MGIEIFANVTRIARINRNAIDNYIFTSANRETKKIIHNNTPMPGKLGFHLQGGMVDAGQWIYMFLYVHL